MLLCLLCGGQFYERHGFAVLYVLDTTLGRDVQKIFLGRKLEPVPAAR